MSERVTYAIEQRPQGWHASVFVDGHRVAKRYCASKEAAEDWARLTAAELKEVVR